MNLRLVRLLLTFSDKNKFFFVRLVDEFYLVVTS